MFIQALVILVALFMLFVAIGNRRSYAGKAWKKIGLTLLAMGMVIAVIFPESTNTIAHILGVGRGADLLLYVLSLVFISTTLNNYLHQQDERDSLYRLARKLALLEAANKTRIKK